MILRILELEKDEKEKLLELYSVINKGKKYEGEEGDAKPKKKSN